MNHAIITVGNRDVYSIKRIPQEISSAREKGEYLLSCFSKYENCIELPIIEPFLNEMKHKNIDIFILVATNQKDQIENSYFQKDTVYYAKIIKKILSKKFPKSKTKFLLISENVNDYHTNYSFFQENLKKIIKRNNLDKLYLLPVGGMPNINGPLLLSAIMNYREKVFQYNINEETKSARIIPFNQQFLKELEKERIKIALDKYFFASIADISSNNFVKNFALYAYNRLNFNFYDAKILIDKLIISNPNKNLSKFSDSLTQIENDFLKKIEELYFTAQIKIMQKQYIDALLRLFSFSDNLLLYRVCELYHLKYDPAKNFEDWWKKKATKKISKEYPNIETELKIENVAKPDLKRAGLPLYESLIRFIKNNDDVLQISNPLIVLSKLRNKSFVTHGFDGISLKTINKTLSDNVRNDFNLEKLMDSIEKFLGITFADSCYNQVRKIIKEEIGK